LKKIDPPHIPHCEPISEKESTFVKEKAHAADSVKKEDDPFLDW